MNNSALLSSLQPVAGTAFGIYRFILLPVQCSLVLTRPDPTRPDLTGARLLQIFIETTTYTQVRGGETFWNTIY
jgi:hypothetical protein